VTAEAGVIVLVDLDATRALARDALRRAGPGSLLLLTGPLGSGKTTFTRLLAEELGATAAVTSPTYTLVHEYPTPEGVLVHVDAYRLRDATALEGLGLDAYLERARLVVVEWGDALAASHPEALWLAFSWSVSTSPARDDANRNDVVRSARWMRTGSAAAGAATP